MTEWYIVVEHLSPLLILLAGVLVKYVIRGELKPVSEKVDDHEGRLLALEQWRLIVANDVHAIPAHNAILTRLESTISRTDGTLDRLIITLTHVIERITRMKGRDES
ncbi:MAG TPA: hypothetical protein VNU46_05090 [Gemmatimonadaceae bacterium]|jgi:hypothetical protein|nr:hypothetical protein [Gemmatimonadaceae bacterium]